MRADRCQVCGKLPRQCVCDLPPTWQEYSAEAAAIVLLTVLAYLAFCVVPEADRVLAW